MLNSEELKELVVEALTEMKANDIKVMDVRSLTELTDHMVIASGTSNRHVRSLVNSVVEEAKGKGVIPLGVEGRELGEWILIDLTDVVVHVMLPQSRDFYDLERLWEVLPDRKGDAST